MSILHFNVLFSVEPVQKQQRQLKQHFVTLLLASFLILMVAFVSETLTEQGEANCRKVKLIIVFVLFEDSAICQHSHHH